jgi:hypothetical protein
VRVLNLPFGVRDGASSAGNFSARYQFEQTRHGKPLIGGYLSRVSRRRLAGMTAQYPILGTLIALSEGQPLSPVDAAAFTAAGPSFIAEAEVGYVIIDAAEVTPQLRTLAIDAFALDAVATDGTRTLYRPRP